MIARDFYTFAEAAERLGIDTETLEQAVGLGKLSIFQKYAGKRGTQPDSVMPVDVSDPYANWRLVREDIDFDGDGHMVEVEYYVLQGWNIDLSGFH